MNVTLEIPDAEVDSLTSESRLDSLKQRLTTELALVMYERALLPVGKAMELAGLTRREFHELLTSRGAIRPFDDAELERELSW